MSVSADSSTCVLELHPVDNHNEKVATTLRIVVVLCSAFRSLKLASLARLFRTVAELNACESREEEEEEEEELLPKLLRREKSLVAFENVIVMWHPGSDFIAWIRLIRLGKPVYES